MSDGYVKVYESILQSTIWLEAPETKIVWITMLTLKDKEGVVHASIPGLANTAGVTLEACEVAINRFLSPDPYSRTKEFDGRRIREVDGGWLLINHAKYRDLRTEKNINDAKRQREYRQKHVTRCHTMSHDVTARNAASGDGVGDGVGSVVSLDHSVIKNTMNDQPKIVPENVQAILDAYASAVASRSDWKPQLKPPTSKEPKGLIQLRASEADFVGMLDRYVELVTALDWAEAKDITFFLRRKTFDNCMSGEWGPSQKKTARFQRAPEPPPVADPTMDLQKKKQLDELQEIINARNAPGTNLF